MFKYNYIWIFYWINNTFFYDTQNTFYTWIFNNTISLKQIEKHTQLYLPMTKVQLIKILSIEVIKSTQNFVTFRRLFR